jgi:hypothetical protein
MKVGKMVEEILLGDNPLIGVSHLAQEKAREEQKESIVKKKVEVMEAAIDGGVSGFTFSTHPSNLELLQYMAEEREGLLNRLNYYILVPYAQQYVRKANVLGTTGLIRNVLKDALKPSKVKLLLPPKLANLAALLIEAEPYLKILPRKRVKALLLHEVLTELTVAFNLTELIYGLKEYFKRKGVSFGLETRNIGQLQAFLGDEDINVEYVMTPMNPMGYQMAPSKEEAERAIEGLAGRGTKIIAINVLASGAISLENACKYLRKFKDRIYAVAYGTSKPSRAKGNATMFRRCFLIE